MRHFPAPDPDAPRLVLAHGAGAGHEHPWMTRVAAGLASRGVHVVTFNFPYKDAGRSVPDRPAILEAAFVDIWKGAGAVFAGGKSMGGRIASQVASKGGFGPALRGLVYFGYPLHPPGKPEQRRDSHLPGIDVPMLFVQGTRDPFATPEEITALVTSLGKTATLELVDGGDHSLAVPKRQDPGGRSFEQVLDVAARWMKGRRA